MLIIVYCRNSAVIKFKMVNCSKTIQSLTTFRCPTIFVAFLFKFLFISDLQGADGHGFYNINAIGCHVTTDVFLWRMELGTLAQILLVSIRRVLQVAFWNCISTPSLSNQADNIETRSPASELVMEGRWIKIRVLKWGTSEAVPWASSIKISVTD